MQGAFYGVGAAVIAIIGYSAVRLIRKTVGADRLLWAIAIANAAIVAITEREIVWVIVASGATDARGARRAARGDRDGAHPRMDAHRVARPAEPGTISTILLYFARGGALVFGSGLAIVPFLHGGVVRDMHWLTEQQFLDAVAVSMITPGPVVITVAFIGYLVAGPLGACAAAGGVFLPVYLIVISWRAGSTVWPPIRSYARRWRGDRRGDGGHRRRGARTGAPSGDRPADGADLRRRAGDRRAREAGARAGTPARGRGTGGGGPAHVVEGAAIQRSGPSRHPTGIQVWGCTVCGGWFRV